MIEVVLYFDGREVACAEPTDDPEVAILAARTMWDDEVRARSVQGIRHFLSVSFIIAGGVTHTVRGRRP